MLGLSRPVMANLTQNFEDSEWGTPRRDDPIIPFVLFTFNINGSVLYNVEILKFTL